METGLTGILSIILYMALSTGAAWWHAQSIESFRETGAQPVVLWNTCTSSLCIAVFLSFPVLWICYVCRNWAVFDKLYIATLCLAGPSLLCLNILGTVLNAISYSGLYATFWVFA